MSEAEAATSGPDVAEDPELTPTEKETTIRFAKDEDRLTIHSEQTAVVRWLLDHPEFREQRRRVEGGTVHAVTGRLPVGCLKLSGSSRQANTPSSVTGTLPD